MLEPAERGVLHGRPGRIVGVDLDDPAEAVRLVRVLRGVEAGIVLVPAITEARLGDPVAPLRWRHGVAFVDEVAVEVLLAGEVRAPRRDAVRAVVDGAERRPPLGVGGRPQSGMARRGPVEADRGPGGHPAGVAGRPDDGPAVVDERDLDDRHAVGGLGLGDLLRRPRRHAADVEQAVVGVLVVHRQEAAAGGRGARREREEVEAVVVHTRLLLLVGDRVARIGAERRPVGDRVAPGVQDLGRVSGRNDHRVGDRDRHALEAQQRWRRVRQRAGPSQHGERGGGEAALQQAPSGEPPGHDFVKGRVGGWVDADILVVAVHVAPLVASDTRSRMLRRDDRAAKLARHHAHVTAAPYAPVVPRGGARRTSVSALGSVTTWSRSRWSRRRIIAPNSLLRRRLPRGVLSAAC